MGGAYHCFGVNLSRQFESVSSFGVFACVWIFSVNLFSDYFHHPSTLHALLLLISSFRVFTFLASISRFVVLTYRDKTNRHTSEWF